MGLYLPSNLREKQLSENIWKWARRVLDETPSRVVPVLLLDANGHISQTPRPEQIGKYSSKKTSSDGQCLGELLRDLITFGRQTHTFPVGATFFGPFSNTQIDFACLPAAVHVHRCCALHHDGDRLQLAAAPGRRDHRPIQCVFQHQLTCGIHEKKKARASMGQEASLHRVPFSRRTRPPFCHEWRKHAGTTRSGTIWRSPIFFFFGRNSIKCS